MKLFLELEQEKIICHLQKFCRLITELQFAFGERKQETLKLKLTLATVDKITRKALFKYVSSKLRSKENNGMTFDADGHLTIKN